MTQFPKLKGKKIIFLVISDFIHDARVLKEAQSAQKAGMKVTVLVPQAPKIMTYAKKNGLKVICVESSIGKSLLYFWRKIFMKSKKPSAASLTDAQMRFWPCVGTIFSIWLINRQFVKIVRNLKPDIVHANDPVTLLAAYTIKRQLGCKFVYDSHELYSEILANPHPLWKAAVIWVEKKSFYADGVMTVNNRILKELNRRYHLGAISKAIVMNAPRYERQSHHEQKLPIKIVYIGSLAKHRGVEDFANSVKSLPNIELWTIGKENLKIGQLHNLPAVAPRDIVKTLSRFDVGVIPFKYSSLNNLYVLPNKFFEYMMAGLAVASSNLPEIAEIITKFQNGLVFNPSDPKDIRKQIRSLISNPEILNQYKKNSLKAAKEYSWENQEKNQLGLYSKVIQNHELRNLKIKPRIFVGPIDAGTNELFKEMMERNGFRVTTSSIFESKFKRKNDINFGIVPEERKNIKIAKAVKSVFKIFCQSFDIFHFRSNITLFPANLDLPVLKLLRKKIIMQYEGSDLRQFDKLKQNPNQYLTQEYEESRWRSVKKRIKYRWIKIWADKIIVSTPDLLEFAPGAEFVPNFILNIPESLPDFKNKLLNILHAPTNRKVKGTRFLLRAVKKLQKEKYPIKLVLLENVPHDLVNTYYEKADIVVDQLLIGIYSVVSKEAMAFGKPVISYIRTDLRKIYPEDLPIVTATPETIYEVLKDLILDSKKRQKIGKDSQKFALKYHSLETINTKWQKIYQNL